MIVIPTAQTTTIVWDSSLRMHADAMGLLLAVYLNARMGAVVPT